MRSAARSSRVIPLSKSHRDGLAGLSFTYFNLIRSVVIVDHETVADLWTI